MINLSLRSVVNLQKQLKIFTNFHKDAYVCSNCCENILVSIFNILGVFDFTRNVAVTLCYITKGLISRYNV